MGAVPIPMSSGDVQKLASKFPRPLQTSGYAHFRASWRAWPPDRPPDRWPRLLPDTHPSPARRPPRATSSTRALRRPPTSEQIHQGGRAGEDGGHEEHEWRCGCIACTRPLSLPVLRVARAPARARRCATNDPYIAPRPPGVRRPPTLRPVRPPPIPPPARRPPASRRLPPASCPTAFLNALAAFPPGVLPSHAAPPIRQPASRT